FLTGRPNNESAEAAAFGGGDHGTPLQSNRTGNRLCHRCPSAPGRRERAARQYAFGLRRLLSPPGAALGDPSPHPHPPHRGRPAAWVSVPGIGASADGFSARKRGEKFCSP